MSHGPHDYRLGFPNAGLLAIFNGKLWALVQGGFDWVDVRDLVDGARCILPPHSSL